jgi:hypothetical protein
MNELLSLAKAPAQTSAIFIIYNLLLCLFTSLIIRWIFLIRGMTFGSRVQISRVIPMLSAVTFLVIVIIKSPLALSLALVGALSIVRFRSAMKEPEELVFIFLAISTGLGFGANQAIVTISITFMILAFIMFAMFKFDVEESVGEVFSYVEWDGSPTLLKDVLRAIGVHGAEFEVVRVSIADENNRATIRFFESKKDMNVVNLESYVEGFDKMSFPVSFDCQNR